MKLPIVHQLRATLHAFSDRRSRRLSERAKKANRARYRRWLILGEPLEDRALLAGFTVSGSTLALNLIAANESVAITSAGSTYAFVLTGGTWSGTDGGGATGNGLATLTATAASFTDVTVDDSSTGNNANFNNSGANTYSSSFTVMLDNAAAGAITFNGNTPFAGSAALSASTSKNIVIASSAVVSVVDGNLSLSANQQASPTTGNFFGIHVNAAQVKATGIGNVTFKGKGGDNAAGSQFGVYVQAGGKISGGTAGTVTVEGRGGPSSGNANIGVDVNGSGSAITSAGANVVVSGFGGLVAAANNAKGVLLTGTGSISATGAGTVSVTGTGGTSSTGAGVEILSGSQIISSGGEVQVTGTGGGGAATGINRGVFVGGTIRAAGSGNVTVTGTGGSGSSGNNAGVLMEGSGGGTLQEIKSGTGNVIVTGTAGGGSGSPGIALNSVSGATATISTSAPGGVALVADSMSLVTSAVISAPTVSIAPKTAGSNMDLGSTSDSIANTLALSQTELNAITASTLNLGDANTAAINVSAAITLPGGTTANLTAAAINLNGNTVSGGTVNQTTAGQPLIAVEQPVGSIVSDGGTKNFGDVSTGSVRDLVFTIKNAGFADLTGLGITIDGTNASEFSVIASPSAPVAAGSNTTFTVRHVSASVGTKTAALHIASNATGTLNPLDINLTAFAPSPSALSGTKSVGPTGYYTSLTQAITDIQGAGLSGPLVIELQPTYVSIVESFPLVFSNLGTTAVNTLTVRPATGATNLLISSADTTAATVDLNNAQFVTIDGRPGGVGSNAGSGVGTASQLTIANTSTSGVAVRFINEASNNTISYTTLRGVNTSFVNGVILFSTTTGTSGNDNNTIDHCDIRDGASTPNNGLTSLGSTGTAAQANSGNTVLNSNIFNFYTSAATDSVGLRLDVGNSDWSISGNSFYQTATRSGNSSTNNPARAIFINSPVGNNFAVTGNFIGGDSPGAAVTTQKWTAGGTGVAYRFNAIQLNVGSTTASSVQGNTIANIAWTTNGAVTTPGNGPFTGIYVVAGNVNVGTVTGNTIGSGTGTGSISVTTAGNGGTSFGIGSASSGTVAIANNTIGSITTNGSSASVAASLIGIQVTAGTNAISNNLVGSTATANSLNAATASTSTTGQQVTGIFSSSTTSASITGNTVANLNNAVTNSPGQIRGIVTSAGVNTITGNTVRNLSTTSRNVNSGMTATTGQSVVGIAAFSTTAGQTVSQNTVHSLSNTTATASVSVTGIYFAGPTSGTNVIARNFVHSLAVSSTSASSVLNGMLFVAGTFTAQNNMVRVGLKADGTSTAGASFVRGIIDSATTEGRNFYHNSVYVGGTQTSLVANTFAFFSTGVSNARTFQNNIFVNARSNSGGTGKHYAVSYGGTTVNPTGLTAGGNIFLASGTGGVLGSYNNVDRSTLAAWQAATGQDATSAVADPLFVAPTGTAATVDLHLQTSNPAEGGGVVLTDAVTKAPVTVTDDFDGQTRSTLTPADVGADAGNFTPTSDLFAPGISYPLLTSGSTANRVLTGWASITDNSGSVSSGANAPRLYFKRSTDADVFGGNTSADNGWKYVTATGSGPYSFTLDYSLINGGSVSAGDTIQYFVVAQDAANNLGSCPAAATASANPPVQNINAKPGAGVNSFSILGSTISGTKTVGTGGDYPSLSGAGGLFAALNASVLTGNVVVNITSDLTETGSVSLNQFAMQDFPADYTLTIQPDSATMRTIFGTATAGLITLNSADRVTIDGRFGGSGRFLTFRNTSTATGASTILFVNDASNNSVRNCVVEGAGTNTGTGVILFSTGTVTGNDKNLITENQVRDVSTAAGVPTNLIGSSGTSAAVSNSGNTVSNNEMFNFNENGIFIGSSGNESWTLSGNEIYEVNAATGNVNGIQLQGGSGTNVITDNFIHDLLNTSSSIGIYFRGTGTTTIARNRITAFNVNAATIIVYGIVSQGGSGSTLNVVNNQITLSPAASTSRTLYGLFDDGFSDRVVNVYHNSIVLGGTETGTNNSWASYRNVANTHTARNNLFLNFRTGGTGNHFAAGSEGTGGSYTASNNVYAGTGATAANFMDFSGTSGTAVPMSFATWQSSTGDTNSQAGLAGSGNFTSAMFVSAATGDLHLVPGGNVLVNGTGTPIPGVTTDFDGDLRSLTAPNIGSDEFAAPNAAPTAVVLSPSSASLAESANTTSATQVSTITITDDALGTNTLSLSGADAASFEIVAGKLYLKAGVTLDYETKSSYSVTVHVDDSTVGNTPDASATFTLSITNVTELTGIDVQKGQKQRSFVRNVDILFDNDAGLSDLLSGNRVRLTRMDLNGLNPTVMTLPTGSVSGNQIQLDFGAQGIGGNRSSNAGDGYYQIAIDMDGDGSFESIKHFFRLYGDVTGDGLVDSRDKAQVLSMSGTTNVEGDLNGDGVVNLADTTAVSRAVGRKLKAGLTWDD